MLIKVTDFLHQLIKKVYATYGECVKHIHLLTCSSAQQLENSFNCNM